MLPNFRMLNESVSRLVALKIGNAISPRLSFALKSSQVKKPLRVFVQDFFFGTRYGVLFMLTTGIECVWKHGCALLLRNSIHRIGFSPDEPEGSRSSGLSARNCVGHEATVPPVVQIVQDVQPLRSVQDVEEQAWHPRNETLKYAGGERFEVALGGPLYEDLIHPSIPLKNLQSCVILTASFASR